MAAKRKKRRKRISPERIVAVLAELPANELLRIRHELKKPLAPKKRTGRPITLMTGQKWGSWNIGPRADRPGVFYLALCDCGNLGIVDASLLRRGMSTKCRQCAGRGVAKNLPRVRALGP